MVDIVGVSRARTSGSLQTREGKKRYRGKRKHWYVYFYDDEGKFRKRMISPLEVPYYGSQIRRRKSYQCANCGTKFRAMNQECPKCGLKSGIRLGTSGKRVTQRLENTNLAPVLPSRADEGTLVPG